VGKAPSIVVGVEATEESEPVVGVLVVVGAPEVVVRTNPALVDASLDEQAAATRATAMRVASRVFMRNQGRYRLVRIR
jgi:hypothetical protein